MAAANRCVKRHEDFMTNNERIRALRRHGIPLREIADKLGVSMGKVCRAIYTRSPITPTERSVVKYVPMVGCGGSMSCYYQPISLPRLRFLEGAAA
jgi:hypothetical protein